MSLHEEGGVRGAVLWLILILFIIVMFEGVPFLIDLRI